MARTRKGKETRRLNGAEAKWWRKIVQPLFGGDQEEAEAQFLNTLDLARRKKLPKWTPFVRATTFSQAGKGLRLAEENDAPIYMNSRYQVTVYPPQDTPAGRVQHLCLKSNENDTHHDWRDFQRIKNELVGPEYEAVEVYPAESRLVDTANQYHLWVLLDSPVPFGFGERLVSESASGYSRQRKWPDGERPDDAREITPEELDQYQKNS